MVDTAVRTRRPIGKLALEQCGLRLELAVMHTQPGWYIGTYNDEGPVSRESEERWPTRKQAQEALDAGGDAWTQRWVP